MSRQNTVRHIDGQSLTGRKWRRNHPLVEGLPFYSNIAKMETLADPLDEAFLETGERQFKTLLVVSLSYSLFIRI